MTSHRTVQGEMWVKKRSSVGSVVTAGIVFLASGSGFPADPAKVLI
jgi:hypothetical protein